MYYVYVLKSLKSGEYYKGLTINLDRRISDHLMGKSRYTKKILPVKLVHAEMCNSRQEARKVELFLKSGFGREIIKELLD